MIEIKELSVSDLASDTLQIEITIADNADLEKASVWLVAKLAVQRKGLSLENVASSTLGALRELIEQAADPVEQKIREQP